MDDSLSDDESENEALEATADDDKCSVMIDEVHPKRFTGKYDKSAFVIARKREFIGLIQNGTFIPTPKSEIQANARVFGSRILDELNKTREGPKRKSRLVAQGYKDEGAISIATKAPMIQSSSQSILMPLAQSTPNVKTFGHDINQAYIQSR